MPYYLIAYDIAHPRRLRRVARLLEKHAMRVQYSVFLFEGEKVAVEQLLDLAAKLLKPSLDVIQAWHIGGDPHVPDLIRGIGVPARPAAVVMDGKQTYLVKRS
jgi:CRISPR-associated endonuclease Cas2